MSFYRAVSGIDPQAEFEAFRASMARMAAIVAECDAAPDAFETANPLHLDFVQASEDATRTWSRLVACGAATELGEMLGAIYGGRR